MALLASVSSGPASLEVGPLPMLTVQQTAVLLGTSRTTVIRKADAGELPCVVVSRGTRQKMRRFPRAAIEELATCGGGGAHVELAAYTAQWLTVHAVRSGRGEG
jgi:excisionase family DNA binding protein